MLLLCVLGGCWSTVIDLVDQEGLLLVGQAETRGEGVLPEGGGANELLVEVICVVVVRETVGEVLTATPAWETLRVAMFQSLVWTSVERVLNVGTGTPRQSLTARGRVILVLKASCTPFVLVMWIGVVMQ